jgi:hypothetical protein
MGARVMGHRAYIEGWTDRELLHHIEQSHCGRFGFPDYPVMAVADEKVELSLLMPWGPEPRPDVSGMDPYILVTLESARKAFQSTSPENIKVVIRHGTRMVRLVGGVFFGNLDDERHQHGIPDSCVDANCWHRASEGRLFSFDNKGLDFFWGDG